jgi:hypothetical protein
MKRFRFSMERVRHYRKLQLDFEQARMDQLQARLQSLAHMEAELERQKRQAQLAIVQTGMVDGSELRDLSGLQDYTSHMRQRFSLERVRIQSEITAQSELLIEARRRFEILERLKDKSRKRWQVDYNREEEQLATESFLAKWTT